MRVPTILVLAGKRDGALDPLAERAGVSHKAVIPVAGKPLISHVLERLEEAWDDAKIIVSIHDPAVLDHVNIVRRLREAGRLDIVEAEAGLVESVERASQTVQWPLLITTGDNALTTVEALHAIAAVGDERQADAVIGVVSSEAIQAAYPYKRKGFYEFKDVAISNCNLFWLRDAGALAAAEPFRRGGQFAKRKGELRRAFGLMNLIRFRFKLDTLDGAMARLSRRFGVRAVAHLFEDGKLAIDVDNQESLEATEALMAADNASV
ncbi:NTP transferase domain-containing protein [Parasphingopyxis sp.]|uniref:NTP transferase domain-containing protein n=1 Tax=Parasphingopyxis sp. TaxID=1920299 RepID=UPI002623C898|nr:NTP transferase domain-containing protein [Parasphingopyxis sp.]